MTKVHLATDAVVRPVKPEMDGVTPIVPLKMISLQLLAPTTDEWPLPFREGEICVALHPGLAKDVAHALLAAVQELESNSEHR